MLWSELTAPAIGFVLGMGAAALALALRGAQARAPSAQRRASDERRADAANRLGAFEHVIDSAGIGMYFWDMSNDTLHWSPHHYTIFDWPQGMPVTHAMFKERVHPDDRDEVERAIAEALRARTDYLTRFRLRLPDGSLRYVRGSGRVVYDNQGQPAGMNGAVIDVTLTTEALIATRQRELDLATVAANLPDVISRFDRQRRWLFVSPRIEELSGHAPDYFIGKTHDDLDMDPLLAARWRAVLEDVVRNKVAREFDFSDVDQHGRERFFITRAVPSFDEEGEVATVLTIATDHTERERATRQLRANGVLLEKADVRKNEYLATLAHELRGPLAPISSATQLIKLSSQRPVREKAREVIERQVAQLANLVGDLMEVGRISSGKLEIDQGRVTVQHVVAQAVESTRPLLDAKGQALTLDLPPAPLWIDGDALRLTQVFSNLLTNASKYSPQAAPVELTARVDGANAVISVRDHGIGLTESAMLDIFDLFVQVHATGVQAQGGLGIGLSLVRQLVELHHGRVDVASDGLGQGSCFSVTLPLGEQQGEIPAADAPAPQASAPLTVLVVDDNVDGATTLASLLEALGHEAVTAFNGRDAVALAAQRDVDLAFVDLGLPDISGVQVALTIRGTPKGRTLPLVALTGLGRDEDRYLTQAAQFNEHLVKPLQMDDLLRITDAVASKDGLAEPASLAAAEPAEPAAPHAPSPSDA